MQGFVTSRLVSSCLALFAAACASLPAASLVAPQGGEWDHPSGRLQTRFAVGTAEAEATGEGSVEADAMFVGLSFEAGGRLMGGGLDVDFYVSDDLVDTTDEDETLAAVNIFPHLTIRPTFTRFRMPIRIGPYVGVHSLTAEGADGAPDATSDAVAFGLQGEIEPEFDILREEGGSALSAFLKLQYGAGWAVEDVDDGTTEDSASTSSANFGFEVGVRYQISLFLLECGYLMRTTNYGESDLSDEDVIYPEVDYTFSGFQLSLGIRW